MPDTTILKRSVAGVDVHPIGLGEMPMSLDGRPDEEQSIRTIHAALDAGVNLIDTADAYARDDRDIGHGERLIAKALKGRRDDVLVATKGGLTRNREQRWPPDGRPEYLRAACEASLRALETDRIDLYQFHRPDPERALRRIDRDVQGAAGRGQGALGGHLERHRRRSWRRRWASSTSSRCRTSSRWPTPRRSPRASCRRARIAASPSCPGRHWAASARLSRRAGVDPVAAAAQAHGVSPQQVALAWLLSLGPTVIPIPGASRPETITDSLRAAELELSDAERQAISAAVGVA